MEIKNSPTSDSETLNIFSYENFETHFKLNPNKYLVADDYVASILITNTRFIALLSMSEVDTTTKEGELFKQYGLKFHVSLPEHEPTQFNNGWDIIRDILIRHKIVQFKIIKPGFKMSDVEGQAGKDVTIYTIENPDKDVKAWEVILTEITQALTNSQISPGYQPIDTTQQREGKISGSNYITYRYDDEKNIESGWPEDDLCTTIKVNVANQLSIYTNPPKTEVQSLTTSLNLS